MRQSCAAQAEALTLTVGWPDVWYCGAGWRIVTLMKTYPDLVTVGSSADMRNKRPFAYPVPQGDEVWLTFVNNWISLKEAEGFFGGLEAKWLSAKK